MLMQLMSFGQHVIEIVLCAGLCYTVTDNLWRDTWSCYGTFGRRCWGRFRSSTFRFV